MENIEDSSCFKFAYFTLMQSDSGMKVSTDSRLLAAYARRLSYNRVLDIGCGMGIISFILAHANPESKVIGIDISEKAIQLAQQSLEKNPNFQKIEFRIADVKNIENEVLYDLVISNPPYFINQLTSKNENRNLYRHCDRQFIENFCNKATSIISSNANICIIIPPNLESEWTYFLSMKGIILYELIYFNHTEHSDHSLVICAYSKKIKNLKVSKMQLMNSDQKYTHVMQEWLGDY